MNFVCQRGMTVQGFKKMRVGKKRYDSTKHGLKMIVIHCAYGMMDITGLTMMARNVKTHMKEPRPVLMHKSTVLKRT